MSEFDGITREGLIDIIKGCEQKTNLHLSTIARLEADKTRLVEALKNSNVDISLLCIELSEHGGYSGEPVREHMAINKSLIAEMEKSND